MSIVTRTGDGGKTNLFGVGRVPKDIIRIHAYGDVDELNSIIGLVLTKDVSNELKKYLLQIQQKLFRLGADLATPHDVRHKDVKRMRSTDCTELESWIHLLEDSLPPQTTFLLPNGSEDGCILHHARAICRRAERWVVSLSREKPVNKEVQIYLNRLSDFLCLAARKANINKNHTETIVDYS
jgi:cob(I)alamin adenosyltransferase